MNFWSGRKNYVGKKEPKWYNNFAFHVGNHVGIRWVRKTADERISTKKERISLYLVYNIVSLGKMTGKAEPFSWRSVEDELAVKYLENLDV